MKLKTNTKYKLCIKAGNKVLTFTGMILAMDNNFVSFKDKFNKILNYNLNTIVSYEEVK